MLHRLAGVTLAFVLTACSSSSAETKQVFVTDYGMGPDKWATAWLLTRHVAPGSQLAIVESGQPVPPGTTFDMPKAALRRQGDQAAFEVTRATYVLENPEVGRLAQIVHDIEVNFWAPEKDPASPVVERAFRALQQREGRDAVTPECYLAFFDGVSDALRAERTEGKPVSIEELIIDCRAKALISSQAALVPEVPIGTLLAEIKRGKTVMFVDVRESSEFREAHIPGALNFTLRDVGPSIVDEVGRADYVVSYCVKDFRGFEMAKALRQAGVNQSVILSPYGLKGWVSQGLPVAGVKALSEADAVAQLQRCVDAPDSCQSPIAKH